MFLQNLCYEFFMLMENYANIKLQKEEKIHYLLFKIKHKKKTHRVFKNFTVLNLNSKIWE